MEHTPKKRAYLIYGNHGQDPTGLNDYFVFFLDIFKHSPYELKLERDCVPNEFNIYLEMFSASNVRDITSVKQRYPQTRLACLCTEFVNGNTFNFFGGDGSNPPFKYKVYSFLFRIIPKRIRRIIKGICPQTYSDAKGIVNSYQLDHMAAIFKKRFDCFRQLEPSFDYLWCVGEFQLEAYRERFPNSTIRYFPIVTYNTEIGLEHDDQEKDIDILFSGSLTTERRLKLDRLSKMGLKVVAGMWSDILRNEYIRRTKVCLHLKQNTQWKYPSVMRLHHLLISGAIVLSEKCDVGCIQEQVVTQFAGDDLYDKALALIERGGFAEMAHNNFDKYVRLLENDRRAISVNIERFLTTKHRCRDFGFTVDGKVS